MDNYTVSLKCEFIENVVANNESEAEQLAMRLLEISLGQTTHCIAHSDVEVIQKPKSGETENGNVTS